MNVKTLPNEKMIRSAMRRLLQAMDGCHDMLKCSKMLDGATCLHRARSVKEERLCRACRLIDAVDDLERMAT